MALQFLAGPYRLPNVDIVGHCVYTNTQPSGSVRAPGAPQAAWALEQHMDELAAALGMDAVELRRKNLLRDGDEAPLGQFMDSIHAIETLERAAELIGWGKPVPEGEAIGIACGWWPSFPMASGVYIKINGDGSPTIITGAQECGTGAVMTLPILAGEILGHDAGNRSRSSTRTPRPGPGTAARAARRRSSTTAAPTVDAAETIRRPAAARWPANSSRSPRPTSSSATAASRRRVRPTRFVTIASLAATANGDQQLIAKGTGAPPPTPAPGDTSRVSAGSGMESFAAPTFGTHAVRIKVDRKPVSCESSRWSPSRIPARS